MYLTYGGTFDRARQTYFKKIIRHLGFSRRAQRFSTMDAARGTSCSAARATASTCGE